MTASQPNSPLTLSVWDVVALALAGAAGASGMVIPVLLVKVAVVMGTPV